MIYRPWVSVLYFLLMIGVLVTVHELGHFLAAKAVGVKVLSFSLGFGPALLRFTGRETEYRVGAIPLGGYVKLLGEDPRERVAEEDRDRSFAQKSLPARLAVVLAGPAANLLCPLLIYFAVFLSRTEVPAAVIGDVLAGGPAAAAGVRPGDRVLEINGSRVSTWEDLESAVDAGAGSMLRFTLERDGKRSYSYITPRDHVLRNRRGEHSRQGLVGVVQAPFAPVIGVLDAGSPAARAGLRTGDILIAVDGRPTPSYAALERELDRAGPRMQIAYLRPKDSGLGFARLSLAGGGIADVLVERRRPLGIARGELFVAGVEPGSPADRAGLLPGDLLDSLDGEPADNWLLFEQALLATPEAAHRVVWKRGRPRGGVELHEAAVTQEKRKVRDEYGGEHEEIVFGVDSCLRPGAPRMVPIDDRVAWAASHAVTRTTETIGLMARGLLALAGGRLPGESVGGPIMVFHMASVSGAQGVEPFLLMVALISINLGLINLLPIPVLDGGQLVVFAVEAVRRRRLSARAREGVVLAGLVVIVSLTILALRNDIVRYLLH